MMHCNACVQYDASAFQITIFLDCYGWVVEHESHPGLEWHLNSAFDKIVDHDSDQVCFENHWIQVAAESIGCRCQFQDDMTPIAVFLYSQSTLYFNMTKS